MKKVFRCSFFQWCFRWIHPDIGIKLGKYLSNSNKLLSTNKDLKFNGNEEEWLTKYCRSKLKQKHYDFFVFGHRHIPLEVELNGSSKYINLGDWVTHFTYAEFDGDSVSLELSLIHI